MAEQLSAEPEFVATVAVLTFNGEKYLRRILEALRLQEDVESFEVLVIDSGSSDSTLDIVRDFPEVRLHEIPNEEFGHGRTRNLAARLARGRFIAYLTHDAVPATNRWLAELLAPFDIDERVVAVVGKQDPRPGCFPLMKYDIMAVFAQFGPDFGTSLFHLGNPPLPPSMRDAITFYSDVNSAARRDFLRDVIPYRDVQYAEDQMFGQDLIDAGYWKAYAARGAVEHSNDVTFREFGMRIFDETVGLRRIGTPIPELSRLGVLRLSLRGSVGDALRILRDRSWGRKRKLFWLVVNPAYHVRKWSSYRAASLIDIHDSDAVAAQSLENLRKR